MQARRESKKKLIILLAFFCVTLAARLITLGLPGFMDTTDARYAAMGLDMAASGNWVTPYINQDSIMMPYWSKPPLGFWMTAGSFLNFGISEWTARFPVFLATLLMTLFTMLLAERWWGKAEALLAGSILFSSALPFVLSGACTMDAALSACVTGALVSFWLAARAEAPRPRMCWGNAFFVCLGVGALAKGPIVLVFAGLAIGFWLLFAKEWRVLLRLPWFTGGILFFAVAAPWYLLAEYRTPGFLKYFFVSENFDRFVSTKLDIKYGEAHRSMIGAVWIMIAGGTFPWVLVLILGALSRKSRTAMKQNLSSELTFLLSWAFAPLVFLTFGRQVVITYLEPILPAFALLTTYLVGSAHKLSIEKILRILLQTLAIVLGVASVGIIGYGFWSAGEPRDLAAAVGLALSLFGILCIPKNSFDLVLRAGSVAAISCLAYGICVLVFNRSVTTNHTLRTVLKRVLEKSDGNPGVVAFLNEIPESAQLYRNMWTNTGMVVIGVTPREISAKPPRYVVTRAKFLSTVADLHPNNIERIGKWEILEFARPD